MSVACVKYRYRRLHCKEDKSDDGCEDHAMKANNNSNSYSEGRSDRTSALAAARTRPPQSFVSY